MQNKFGIVGIGQNKNLNKEQHYNIRTDLALEASEDIKQKNMQGGTIDYKGMEIEEKKLEALGMVITSIKIMDKNVGERIGKQPGKYYTFEVPELYVNDGGYHREVSQVLSGYIRGLIMEKLRIKQKFPPYHVLVAGLGNREATADALGPMVVGNLDITRNPENKWSDRFGVVSGLVPGVLAQTGMETAEILRGICDRTKPDIVIVVDSLAARNSKRLAATVQLSDTGIMPGSGVGNHRNAIDEDTMGVPVLAIGVPMVVEASAIVKDAVETLFEELREQDSMKSLRKTMEAFSPIEKRQFIREIMPENMAAMYVTPKDVDETVKRISYTISEAFNICFSAGN